MNYEISFSSIIYQLIYYCGAESRRDNTLGVSNAYNEVLLISARQRFIIMTCLPLGDCSFHDYGMYLKRLLLFECFIFTASNFHDYGMQLEHCSVLNIAYLRLAISMTMVCT